MIIIGIDPGLATIGYGVIKYNNPKKVKININNVHKFIKHLACGIIVTENGLLAGKRFQIIYKEITRLLKKHQPEIVCIEKIFFRQNQKTLVIVSQAIGIITLAISRQKIPLYEIAPAEIKFMITQNGKATKKEMEVLIKKVFIKDKLTKKDDSIDALAIATSYVLKNAKNEN